MKRASLWVSLVIAGAIGCSPVQKHAKSTEPRSEEDILRSLGNPRPPAIETLENENVLIGSKEGLQSRKNGLFQDVTIGVHGDPRTKYLWTIDDRGINIALELTPMPTPRGYITHTNISPMARFAGEVWFTGPREVTINGKSKRYGDRSNVTRAQYEAAIEYWERLGYEVSGVTLGMR